MSKVFVLLALLWNSGSDSLSQFVFVFPNTMKPRNLFLLQSSIFE